MALRPAEWLSTLAIYRHPPVVAMLFLGFSAGLPFLLVFSTLSAWLTEAGVSRTAIGFFSWVGITYSIKVIWAPFIDRIRMPFLGRLLGHRRGWLLVAQTCVAGGLAGMAATDPSAQLGLVAVFALVVAFGAATQDVVIDAFRIESAETRLQGGMAAAYILGYRVALLVAGAGALYFAAAGGWPFAYRMMALFMLVGVVTTLLVREPTVTGGRRAVTPERRVRRFLARTAGRSRPVRVAGAWFMSAVVAPFDEFFGRFGWHALTVLAFIGLFRMSDITMGVMANPFYLDLGFTKTQIANVTQIYGFAMTILGSALGGVVVVRLGPMRPLFVGAILVAATNLLFATMAWVGPDIRWLTVVISADNLSGGFAVACFIAYLSGLTSSAYTATQYALFSSLMTLPAKFLGGFSGWVVDGWGYFVFFVWAAVAGVPAILLALHLMRSRWFTPAAPGKEQE